MTSNKSLIEAFEKAGVSRDSVREGSVSIQLKAATDPMLSPNPGASYYDREPATLPVAHSVRDLIPETRVSNASTVSFFTMPATGSAAIVAEGAAKTQVSVAPAMTELPLVNIACYFKVAQEVLEDYPRLASAIQVEGQALKATLIQSQLVTGTGNSGQMKGLTAWNLPGISSFGGYASLGLLTAIGTLVSLGYSPDGIILPATSIERFAGLVSQLGEFASGGGSPTTVISNAISASRPTAIFGSSLLDFSDGIRIAGLRTAFAPVGSANQAIVGDFRRGTKLFSAGEIVTIGYDNDDWTKDLCTVRISERLALAVKDPQALRRVS